MKACHIWLCFKVLLAKVNTACTKLNRSILPNVKQITYICIICMILYAYKIMCFIKSESLLIDHFLPNLQVHTRYMYIMFSVYFSMIYIFVLNFHTVLIHV